MNTKTENTWQSTAAVRRPMRVGVIGINRSWPNPEAIPFPSLYEGLGKNTGNLMFTEAIYSLIGGEITSIGFNFDPMFVNKNFDAVIIPAANWLNNYSDWDWLIERLSDLKIPVTIIGIGLQAETYDLESVKVNDSCRRLIEFFANQSSPISVRGYFTQEWLNSIGVDNVVATGCPSLYMNIFRSIEFAATGKLLFQGTRYGLTESFIGSNGINRRMFEFAVQFDCPMIFQSEPEEMELITSGVSSRSLDEEKQKLLLNLYGFGSVETLDAFMARNGKVFYDLKAWSQFVSEHKGLVGTRLHGAILALNSGRPAMLVPHDSRTAEVAKFAGIQALNGPTVRDCTTLEEVETLFAVNNLEKFRDTRSINQATFVSFLADCGFQPNSDHLW